MIEKLLGLVGQRVEVLLPNSTVFWGPFTIKQVGRGAGYTGLGVLVVQSATDVEWLINVNEILAVRLAS